MTTKPIPDAIMRAPAAIQADLDAGKPVSFKEALSLNKPALNTFAEQIQSGEVSLCACIGPVYGEPHCPCTMKRLGLPSSPEHVKANAEAQARFEKLFGPGGKYAGSD